VAERQDRAADLRVNATISKLIAQDGAATATFSGWVGEGSAEGMTRLYLNINDLSYFIEFESADLVHSTDVAEHVLPFGAIAIWLKADARVRLTRSVRTSATEINTFLSSVTGSGSSGAAMPGASMKSPGFGNAPNMRNVPGRSMRNVPGRSES
jgi:hypothetical protein